MFYKHWKKFLLSVLAFFWSGCENEDEVAATYGCFSTICHNATATNDLGEVFDIIECEDGYYLFKLNSVLEDKNVTKNSVIAKKAIDFNSIQRFATGNLTRIDLNIVAKLCNELNCKVEDLIEYINSK